METSIQEKIEPKKQTEKERLEIVEKKVEIQKKRVEVKKEQLNIDEIVIRRKIALDEQRTLIDKISVVRGVLSEYTIDDEKTILGSEPILVPIIIGERRETVINKLMELIERI